VEQHRFVAPTSERPSVVRGVLLSLLASVVIGLGAGILTSYAQLWLPRGLSSLANSATPWCVVAGLVALLVRSAPGGAVAGVVALLGMDAGYGIGSELRGYAYGAGTALFWAVIALVAGPVVGAGVQWIRQDRPRLAPLAAGVLAGVVVGEGVYGLLVVAATTSTTYWVGQVLLGLVALAVVCTLVIKTSRRIAVAVMSTLLTAVAFVVVDSLPLLLITSGT